MQNLPTWRSILIAKNSIFHSTMVAPASSRTAHLSSFHSTAAASEKRKEKWKPDSRGQVPSKSYIRYTTRQKRSNTKRALKDLLYYGASKTMFQEECLEVDWKQDSEPDEFPDKKAQFKNLDRQRTRFRRRMRKMKRQQLNENWDEEPERKFEAKYGKKWYSWSYKPWQEFSFRNSKSEFEWGGGANSSSERMYRDWNADYGNRSQEQSCFLGSVSDRRMLGLPLNSPLKIEDVKNAFRVSALKWHPDRNQGSIQEAAGEKFKLCVAAYKSLCNALSSN